MLAHDGSVDVMSSVTRDGEWIDHKTQEGVYVVVEATDDYVSGCFTRPSRPMEVVVRPVTFEMLVAAGHRHAGSCGPHHRPLCGLAYTCCEL